MIIVFKIREIKIITLQDRINVVSFLRCIKTNKYN